MQLKSSHCLLTVTTLLVIAMKRPISSLNGKKLRKYFSTKKFIAGAVGLLVAIVSIALFASFRPILKSLIQSKMNLRQGSEFYNFWVNPSVPTEVGIFFFHVLNPWEVQNGGKQIKVKEVGKFMFESVPVPLLTCLTLNTCLTPKHVILIVFLSFFRQHYERIVTGFSDDLSTVTFYERRYYVFDPMKTTGSLDDNITVINAPFAVSHTHPSIPTICLTDY